MSDSDDLTWLLLCYLFYNRYGKLMFNSNYGVLHGPIGKLMVTMFFVISLSLSFSVNANALYHQCDISKQGRYFTFFENDSGDEGVMNDLIYIIQYETGLSFILNISSNNEDKYFCNLGSDVVGICHFIDKHLYLKNK